MYASIWGFLPLVYTQLHCARCVSQACCFQWFLDSERYEHWHILPPETATAAADTQPKCTSAVSSSAPISVCALATAQKTSNYARLILLERVLMHTCRAYCTNYRVNRIAPDGAPPIELETTHWHTQTHTHTHDQYQTLVLGITSSPLRRNS